MAGPQLDPALDRPRDVVPIRRALLSVSDKSGLLELASALRDAGIEIVSTGGSAALLREEGFDVTDVARITGFPESLGGRVKTLHPSVHAGLLADLRLAEHEQQLDDLGILPFELVVVNLYPFAETVASGADGDAVVEQIDIGGPAMVRASAKNFANVAIAVSPDSYPAIIEAIAQGGTTLAHRKELAARAFAHTAAYDRAVATWFAEGTLLDEGTLPQHLTVKAERLATLRYGENAHQRAAIYTRTGGHGIAQATQLQGKEMSYNNYVDADAALRAVYDLVKPAVAIIKHDVDEQASLDGLDALVQRVLGVALEHRHALLGKDRARVDAPVDDDDARAGLGDARGERVAHAVRSGELGQVGGVRVDEARRPRLDDRGGQQSHEAAEHDEIGIPHAQLAVELLAPFLARRERAEGHREGGDAELLGVREAIGLAIGADDDDARGETGNACGFEQRAEVGAGA